MTRWCLLTLIVVLFLVSACSAAPAPLAPSSASSSELVVAAAADLTPAFREMGELFEERTGIKVVFNFGSTGQLAQQIERGAPFDLFYAANKSFIEDLNRKGLVISDTMEVYAQGRITLWTRSDSLLQPERVEDLADPAYRRIAIANPEHAPYGQAAKEALARAGVWEAVQPRLVFGENVAQALTLADTGNVDVALVALSLSIQSNGNWVLIPAELHPDHPLLQMAAAVAGTPREQEARRFMAFVNSAEGHAIMKKYGFVLPGEIVSR
ncbi:MAG: molybdate ABC transporter substrate-binding protein [Roseiflexus sp.]|nr:molybdate ABC transporter substrate-binding protein [Roseiflexus sp.]MCS7287548.1 molybdate ABC transporter substrate-binding protein [Roseiflexus sp.]MDW8148581.1 molybdate ABC transporter substrate-binding protein [Roseiflexaceae bacterium]MDW8231769.1 molybdate ABC transporter substrate-binding protein [Roseiflexaceae bacterium]